MFLVALLFLSSAAAADSPPEGSFIIYNLSSSDPVFLSEGQGNVSTTALLPGTYLVKTFTGNGSVQKYYHIMEDGQVIILDALELVRNDNFTSDGTSSSDGIAWVGDLLEWKIDGYYPRIIDAECLEDDTGMLGSGFDTCFSTSSSLMRACDTAFSSIDCDRNRCQSPSTMQSYHRFIDTSYAHSGEVLANFFVSCRSSGAYRESPRAPMSYKVIDKKHGRCLNASQYVVEGHSGNGGWVQLGSTLTCDAGSVCRDTQDYTSKDAYINPCFRCTIPDGSSWDCECDSDVECRAFGDYYCSQVSGPDACTPVLYEDECSNHNDFFCDGSAVKQCISDDKRWKKKTIEQCSGKYQYCDPDMVDGTGSCSRYPQNFDFWMDYADTGVVVNKLSGDKLQLSVYSSDASSVTVSYDATVLAPIDIDKGCPNGVLSLSKGVNTCQLQVNPLAPAQDTVVKIRDKESVVKVINQPSFLIVTDSQKLLQRYPSENAAVWAALKQAYANAKDNGVVYDLAWYREKLGTSHPFASLSLYGYHETITQPRMLDNSYASAVAQFVKQRCGTCKDILILGDDFVVPSYRREIPTLERAWLFWQKTGNKSIYTDSPYAKKTLLQFPNYYEMFKKDGKYEGKDVLLILPYNLSDEQRTQVERLKKAFSDKGYAPDFSELNGKSAYCVDQSWFSKVKGKTLIIIGTEETNNAFLCMPFVAGDASRDAAFLQPNVWDTKNYALVINTENPEVIKVFSMLVESGNITKLKSESAYFFKVGVQYASYAALGVGVGSLILFSGGTAAPAIFLTAGAALDTISDVGDATDSCVVNNKGNVWCGASIGFAALPYVPSKPAKNIIKKFADSEINSKLKGVLDPVKDLIENGILKKVRKAFGNIAFENGVRTAEDNINIAKGGDFIDRIFPRGLHNYNKNLPSNIRVVLATRLGKYVDILDKPEHVPGTILDTFHFRGRPDSLAYVPTIEVVNNGKTIKFIDWDSLKNKGHTGITKSSKSLEDLKTASQDEIERWSVLGPSHVQTKQDSLFISTSAYARTAARTDFTGTAEGYVFIVNPRTGNFINVPSTIDKLQGTMPREQFEYIQKLAHDEIEMAHVGEINIDSILGVVETHNGNILKDTFQKNPFYDSLTDAEDTAKALKEVYG